MFLRVTFFLVLPNKFDSKIIDEYTQENWNIKYILRYSNVAKETFGL